MTTNPTPPFQLLPGPADQLWVRILSQELYGRPGGEIRKLLVDKHPMRVIDAVVREAGVG